jgi:hypothetical protein
MRATAVALLFWALMFVSLAESAGQEHEIRWKQGKQAVTIRGKLPTGRHAAYRFYGESGQKCKVRIEPMGDLTTAGHLFLPDSEEGYGGPGGTIYDGVLPKTGNYRIWVERRSGKSVNFLLILSCDRPLAK